jgi:hypothetical protein
MTRGRQAVGLSKSAARVTAQRGSAAPTCGKPPAFRPMPQPCPSSAQAGRLSLPACAEEVTQRTCPSERRSLSASQAAEPQVIVDRIEPNLDKPGQAVPLQRFVASTARLAVLHFDYVAIRPKAILRVDAPADAAIGAGDGRVRLSFDEHPLGAQQPATLKGSFRLRSGFRHNHTSPFTARNKARFTATRASWTL